MEANGFGDWLILLQMRQLKGCIQNSYKYCQMAEILFNRKQTKYKIIAYDIKTNFVLCLNYIRHLFINFELLLWILMDQENTSLFLNIESSITPPKMSIKTHNPQSQPQPQKDRICFILFLSSILLMFSIIAYSFFYGDSTQLFRPYRINQSSICGAKDTSEELFPFLYISNPYNVQSSRYCVSECPNQKFSKNQDTFLRTSLGKVTMNFSLNLDASKHNNEGYGEYLYDSILAINRICLPTLQTFQNGFSGAKLDFFKIKPDIFTSFMLDLANKWEYILISFIFSFFLSFGFIIGLKNHAKNIVWVSIIGFIICLGLIGGLILYNDGAIIGLKEYIGIFLVPQNQYKANYSIFAYISIGISVITISIIYFNYQSIQKCFQIIEVAQQIISKIQYIYHIPIVINLVFVFIIWSIFISTIILLVSMSKLKTHQGYQQFYFFAYVSKQDYMMQVLYGFIGFVIWFNSFLIDSSYFMVSKVCADWLYGLKHQRDENRDGKLVGYSFRLLIQKRIGSIALGSFLRIFTQGIESVYNFMGNQKWIEKRMHYLNYCESIVKCVNKSAYIQIALQRKSLFNASKDGFDIQMKYSRQQKQTKSIIYYISFIFSGFIALLAFTILYGLILFVPSIRVNVLQPIYLSILVFFLSLTITRIFNSVFSAAIDTITICSLNSEFDLENPSVKLTQKIDQQLVKQETGNIQKYVNLLKIKLSQPRINQNKENH